eukprot:m.311491 g.311491  ORF g.311491 m.311491 type:complete len:1006 (-) comp20223_c0_seq1:227-3244(-)
MFGNTLQLAGRASMSKLRRTHHVTRHAILRHRVTVTTPARAIDKTDNTPAKRWEDPLDIMKWRHIGVTPTDADAMAKVIGVESLEDLIDKTVPAHLRPTDKSASPEHKDVLGERALLQAMIQHGKNNTVFRSYIGQGYHNCEIPPVIKRNLLENPGWYTQYTPYQAEISQGRLESLFNFQTMICELTSMDIANASLLDEPTAAAEAMSMSWVNAKKKKPDFLVDSNTHPQTISLLKSRAKPLGINVIVSDVSDFDFTTGTVCGTLLHYPGSNGVVRDFETVVKDAKSNGVVTVCCTDLLALTMLKPPGEFGIDIAVGNSQRFGVPLGYGGPHAAFIACVHSLHRKLPGRIIGRSIDAQGNPAYRLSLQTREQHIRRGTAVSNICTAQALLANAAAMYGVYHGPHGLRAIAARVHGFTTALAQAISSADGGHTVVNDNAFFDTITVKVGGGLSASDIMERALAKGINLRQLSEDTVCIALDETVTEADVNDVASVFDTAVAPSTGDAATPPSAIASSGLGRTSDFMVQDVFNRYHSETDMMRYLKHLENKDISLCHTMIPLGSCTMKLNAATEMQGITMSNFADIHPYVPDNQARGYHEMFEETKSILCRVTGYDGLSLQPNSGAQGELAGLMAIRGYHLSRGDTQRNICLVPTSAHGTNPASAVMAGMKVVEVNVKENGVIDNDDLVAKCEKHSDKLAAIMITYPSTFGVFEEDVNKLCDLVHSHGGQVYLDGANMNACMDLVRPGEVGADVSHLNLHKTFCIPHGGGGPGMGPIGVREHLIPFLPSNPTTEEFGEGEYAISGTPYGSSLITTISWAFCKMMGAGGLEDSSKYAILNANYMAARLADHYKIRFRGEQGYVAHEFILDFTDIKNRCGIEAGDVAKRLQDYGFHAPTVSWPITNVLMIEPTESESRNEMDRYCDALIEIRKEIEEVAAGKYPKDNNVVMNAPHTNAVCTADEWDRPYLRTKAAYPLPYLRERKLWPSVGKINDVHGDKNLIAKIHRE